MEKTDSSELEKIQEEILSLNERLTLVETNLRKIAGQEIPILTSEPASQEADIELKSDYTSNRSIEYSIGEYGMAWLGNIVLLIGITFLVQYLQQSGKMPGATLIGFLVVAVIYSGSYFSRNSYSYLSKLLFLNGHLLLFYMSLHLHFFQAEPLVTGKFMGLVILIVVLAILFYTAYRRRSQGMAGLVLLMTLTTGIISNSTPFLAAITTVTALLSIILYYKHGWLMLVFVFTLLVYMAHLNWLINNPIMGNPIELAGPPGISYFNLLVTGALFSLLPLLPKKGNISDEFIITSVIWNGLGFTFVLALSTILYYSRNYVFLYGSIAAFCLIYSVILHARSLLKIMASMYALYGFLAMSVAIYGIFLLPKAYALFAIQSLLVVSMALWFRSRFIVVINTILFLLLMIFYLKDTSSYSSTNFSFMFVALLTARVINWKKERLNIKTEMMRNSYLVAGFIMTLIAFYHFVPESYITASWILAAILFFLTSLLLKNVKYRWLAIASMVASAVKLIFVDMSNIDIGYRVMLFLLLAIVSITASILYTRNPIKKAPH